MRPDAASPSAYHRPMSNRQSAKGPLARTRQIGFTLIEALVVTVILTGLTAMAVPTFRGIIDSYRFNAVRDALADTIVAARAEAIRTGQPVNIAAQSCANSLWSCGWVVYVDLDSDNTQDANEPTFRRVDVVVDVCVDKTARATPVQISRLGQSAGVVNNTFSIGPTGGRTSPYCRTLVLNSGMRQRSDTGTAFCPASPC